MATTKTGTPIDASGNAIDTSIVTVANGTLADANDIMSSLNDIETDLEGHSHSLDSKVGWDSMLTGYKPPSTGDATNKWRLVCGTETMSVAGGVGSAVVSFATDSDQGNPSFIATPRVNITPDIGTHDGMFYIDLVNTTTAAIGYEGATGTFTAHIFWFAYGKVA